jgi:hypothetical protein
VLGQGKGEEAGVGATYTTVVAVSWLKVPAGVPFPQALTRLQVTVSLTVTLSVWPISIVVVAVGDVNRSPAWPPARCEFELEQLAASQHSHRQTHRKHRLNRPLVTTEPSMKNNLLVIAEENNS